MRVAIIGATGFVGGYLVDALLAAGHEPSVLVRAGSEEKLKQAGRCSVVPGVAGDRTALERTLDNCDAAIFLIGILREFPRRGITFEALQYDAVRQTADVAKERGVSRFLLMSANGVRRPPATPYQETKFRAEEYVLQSGLDVTIFRPSVIFGEPRGAMEIATQLHRDMIDTPLPAVGFIKGWNPAKGAVMMSPAHVEDVVSAFVAALPDRGSYGSTYALGGPEALSWSDMLNRIAATVGRRKRILPMPLGLMHLAAALLDRLPAFPVTRDQLRMLAEDNTADSTMLENLIGRPPRAFSPENLNYLRADRGPSPPA